MLIQAPHFIIRHLKRHEIEQLLQLCKAEGRQMGTVMEVESWMHIDPQGFFVAVNEQEQIIGSCAAICLSSSHGYVGMYVVSEEFRGLGIGKQVWNAAIEHLGSRNCGLSAVAHLFTLYRDKAGFPNVADWTVDLYKLDRLDIIFQCQKHHTIKRRKFERRKYIESFRLDSSSFWNQDCIFCCLAHQYRCKERIFLKQRKLTNKNTCESSDDESYGFSNLFFEEKNDSNKTIENISVSTETEQTAVKRESDFIQLDSLELSIKFRYCKCFRCNSGKLRTATIMSNADTIINKVIEFDQKLHQYDRSKIVKLTLTEKNCFSRVALLGETVVGYGCAKQNLQNMWIMSPLYADNEYVARVLMIDLISDLILINQYNLNLDIIPSIVLKVPSNNRHSIDLLNEIGFVKQNYSLKRCYSKKIFEVPTQNIYALHTSVFCTE